METANQITNEIHIPEQTTFNTVITHLRKQGKPAMNYLRTCLYRYNTGTQMLKCAAGCLIPDDMYDPQMEGRSVCHMGWNNTKFVPTDIGILLRKLGHNIQLVFELQKIHDQFTTLLEWESKFQDLAKTWGLEYSA